MRTLRVHQLDRSVVVAMLTVGMMQTPIDEVIDVVTVGNRFVTAVRTVDVTVFVSGGSAASVRIGGSNRDGVLFDGSVFALVVEMAVVKIIDVTVVLDRGVAAAFTVLVVVIWVGIAGMLDRAAARRSSNSIIDRAR